MTGQLLFETLLLAGIGGVLGIGLAQWGLVALLVLLPDALPRSDLVAIDGAVLTFAVAMTGVAALSAGIAPAWKASGKDVVATLRRGQGVFSDWRTMSALVVFELSLAFVLVVGASLLGQAFVAQTPD